MSQKPKETTPKRHLVHVKTTVQHLFVVKEGDTIVDSASTEPMDVLAADWESYSSGTFKAFLDQLNERVKDTPE